MATIRKLLVKLGVKGAASTQRALEKTAKAQDKTGDSIEKTGRKASISAKQVYKFFRKVTRSYGMYATAAKTAAMGAGMIVAAQAALVARTAMYAEQIERLANGFRMTVQEAQGLNAVFMAMGGTTDDATDALTTLTDRAQDVIKNKNKAYAKEFASIGMDKKALKENLEKPYEMLIKFMDKALAAKKLSDKIAVAARIFGDDLGRRLVPLFVSGGDSFKNYIRMFAKFNLFISKKKIMQLRQLMFEGRKFMAFLQGLSRHMSAEMAPILLLLSARISKLILKFKEAMRSKVSKWTKMLGEEFNKIWKYAEKLFSKLDDKRVSAFIDLMIELVPLIGVLAAAFLAVGSAKVVILIFAKLSALGTALAVTVGAVGAVVSDLIGYFNGVESTTGKLVNRFAKGKEATDSIRKAMDNFKMAGTVLWWALKKLYSSLATEGPDGMNTFEEALVLVIKIVSGFIRILSWAAMAIGGVISLFMLFGAGIEWVRKKIKGLKMEFIELMETLLGADSVQFQAIFGGPKMDEAIRKRFPSVQNRDMTDDWSLAKLQSYIPMFGVDGLHDMQKQRRFQRDRNTRIADNQFRRSNAGLYMAGGTAALAPAAPGMTIDGVTINVNGVSDPNVARQVGNAAGAGFTEKVKAATAGASNGKR